MFPLAVLNIKTGQPPGCISVRALDILLNSIPLPTLHPPHSFLPLAPSPASVPSPHLPLPLLSPPWLHLPTPTDTLPLLTSLPPYPCPPNTIYGEEFSVNLRTREPSRYLNMVTAMYAILRIDNKLSMDLCPLYQVKRRQYH